MDQTDYIEKLIGRRRRQHSAVDISTMGVIGRISRLSHTLEKRIEAVLAAHGLQGGRLDVLAALVRAGEPHRLTSDLALKLAAYLIGSRHKPNRSPDRRGAGEAWLGRQSLDAVLNAHLKNDESLISAPPMTRGTYSLRYSDAGSSP